MIIQNSNLKFQHIINYCLSLSKEYFNVALRLISFAQRISIFQVSKKTFFLTIPGGYTIDPNQLPFLAQTGGSNEITGPKLGNIISALLNVAFYIAGVLLVIWLVWGIFQYLFAGGNKEGLAGARKRITYALIGFLIVVLAFFISNYASTLIPYQNTRPTPITGNSDDLVGQVLNLIGLGDKGGTGCSLDETVCTTWLGAKPIALSDFYSSEQIVDTNGTETTDDDTPISFAAAQCTGNCRSPSKKVPFVYHQYEVDVPEYDAVCPQGTSDSVPYSSCGPTSLSMVAEAFNGREDKVCSVDEYRPAGSDGLCSNGQKPDAYPNQTANNLTRLFLEEGLMSCDVGTMATEVEAYTGLDNVAITNETLQVVVYDLTYDLGGGIGLLEEWYSEHGWPTWTNVWYKGNINNGGHYVAVIGISDNYVWTADPMGPEGQYIMRIRKQDFINGWYKDRFWKVYPVYDPPPGYRPD